MDKLMKITKILLLASSNFKLFGNNIKTWAAATAKTKLVHTFSTNTSFSTE